jgi:hypothetical protein
MISSSVAKTLSSPFQIPRNILYRFVPTGTLAEPAGALATPRLIMSCNSSGFEERANATSNVICLAK